MAKMEINEETHFWISDFLSCPETWIHIQGGVLLPRNNIQLILPDVDAEAVPEILLLPGREKKGLMISQNNN